MRLLIGLLAQSVVVDRVSNRVSIFNLIERIPSPNFPLLISELSLFALLGRNPEEDDRQLVTVVGRLGDAEIMRTELQADFQGRMETRLIVNMMGMPIQHPQDLHFHLISGGQQLGVIVVPVEQVPLPLAHVGA